MKKTFEELKEVDVMVAQLYKKDETLKNGKFGYGWSKFYKKNINPTQEELVDKITDNQVENALTDDKTKELLKGTDNNYKYSKEGMKALLEANRKLMKEFDEKEIEVIPYFIKSENLPELTEEQKEELKNLIIE